MKEYMNMTTKVDRFCMQITMSVKVSMRTTLMKRAHPTRLLKIFTPFHPNVHLYTSGNIENLMKIKKHLCIYDPR